MKKVKEDVIHNAAGQEIHVFRTDDETRVKKIDISKYLFNGEQWCPDCHSQMEHKESYWECQNCYYSITDEEVEYGDGCATLEASYDEDYGERYEDLY